MILGDNTYYVNSATTNDCPQPCHPLSYYITNTATYFTSNATFIFMEGEHLLDSKGLVRVVINNVDNITLRGERGHSNTDVDIIIRCSNNTRGLVFINGSIITIYDITITGCGQENAPPLALYNIASIYINRIILHNNMYYGYYNYYQYSCDYGGVVYIQCAHDIDAHITITDSILTNNAIFCGGGIFILLFSAGTDMHNNITITDSTFTNNIIEIDGGGLYIISMTDAHSNITIINSIFTSNTFDIVTSGNGGGLYIYSMTDAHNNITITDSIFTGNAVSGDGGGLYIKSSTNVDNNISITESTFADNTISGNGGGMVIYSEDDIRYYITITDSTFANNIVGYGGGLYMYIYSMTDAHNNITITDSIFTGQCS